MKLSAHEGFLQLTREPWEREGGLHGILQSCFPIDARDENGTGALLEHAGYELEDAGDGAWALYIVLRLARCNAGEIVRASEQSLMVCVLVGDGSVHPYPSRVVGLDAPADVFAKHIESLIFDAVARGRKRMTTIGEDTAPADLLCEDMPDEPS